MKAARSYITHSNDNLASLVANFTHRSDKKAKARLEKKVRLLGCDVAVPASCYDFRLGMSSEVDSEDTVVPDAPPKDPSDTRWKRRRR